MGLNAPSAIRASVVIAALATMAPFATWSAEPEADLEVTEESSWTQSVVGDLSLGFHSAYYFRGFTVFDNTFNLQPSGSLGLELGEITTISTGLWAAIPTKNRAELGDVRDEVNFTFDASFAVLDELTLSAGAIVYLISSAGFDTEDLYVATAWDIVAGLSLSGSVYADINAFDGFYFNLSPSYTLDLIPGLSMTATAFLGATKYGAPWALVETGGSLSFDAPVADTIQVGLAGLYNYNTDAREHQGVLSFTVGYGF